ncbi:biotin--acetyl-CoA-carboxylase ligase [Flavobacterium enshiense DK69]|uniref:Biotin--acetyl-CoA-carboxylase ligase n=1 Tax=Flavobacterium enshiense DK69 TaxID=1107311 RepID=V6SFB0_9FLAO|nr:biotin--[acetyl-CoA-carboxylase] ligase [Flavobacterium enshiense]ESU25251.1 biotin--acetyl-CoA-carboxylase ligase [Flavobacterium enshiense DK69]KGO93156.1 biotin--acetyl-CoA-carboxylase ligase [Flavobacterium enshiense DK69]
MNIIKLDATPSTNDYLKALLTKQFVENFTVVTTENQTLGRGQMGAVWEVETGKNLTFSVLVKDVLPDINTIFHLNVLVAVCLTEVLEELKIPNIAIKWPNDILADNKKIAGILIENSLKSGGEIVSVVGIGLNVNQKNFDGLPKAGSLFGIVNREFDKDAILISIVETLKRSVALLQNKDYGLFWEKYNQRLFKKGLPMPFEDKDGLRFMGIIQGVTANGKLEVLLEDDSIKTFEIKEIQMLY